MKRLLALLILVSFYSAPSFAQGSSSSQKPPIGSVNLMLHGSLAFIGISGELYLGHMGLGAQFSVLPLGGQDGFVIFYEPGGYLRFYPFQVRNSLYVSGGLTFLGVSGKVGDFIIEVDSNLLNYNLGLGYNVFFGDQSNIRLSLEVGPRWVQLSNGNGFIFPHFNLALGSVFY